MTSNHPEMQGQQLHILYVDDDDNDIQLANFAAPLAGFSAGFHSVKSGAEAVDYIQGQGRYSDRAKFPMPKLLLLDLRMPRMNGLELLAWVRSQPELLGMVIIVFTASAHPADITRACQLGANAFVQKPSSHTELVQFLKLLKDFWGGFHEFPQIQQTTYDHHLPRPKLIP
jgi:CheY-like chemotaxis protein